MPVQFSLPNPSYSILTYLYSWPTRDYRIASCFDQYFGSNGSSSYRLNPFDSIGCSQHGIRGLGLAIERLPVSFRLDNRLGVQILVPISALRESCGPASRPPDNIYGIRNHEKTPKAPTRALPRFLNRQISSISPTSQENASFDFTPC